MQEYNKTDQQLHILSQLLTKVNRTFVQKKEDDSHTNLFFDALGNRITGRWIETEHDKLLFTLKLEPQEIEVVNENGKPLASIALLSKQITEIEQEIERILPGLGLNSNGFSQPLHFEIPEYEFTAKPVAKFDSEGLFQWKHYRQLANEACYQLMGYAQKWDEVRIWPHHFDTGIYIAPNSKLGIGFGLAMEDGMAGSPYFYLAGYALKSEITYNNLPLSDEWDWKTDDNWKGVI